MSPLFATLALSLAATNTAAELRDVTEKFSAYLKAAQALAGRSPVERFRDTQRLVGQFIAQYGTAIRAVQDDLVAVRTNDQSIREQKGYAEFLADLNRLKEMRSRMELKPGSTTGQEFSRSEGLLRVEYRGRPTFTVEQSEGSEVQNGLNFLSAKGFVCGSAFTEYVTHYGVMPDLSTTEGSAKWNWYLLSSNGDPELSAVDFLSDDRPFVFEVEGRVTQKKVSQEAAEQAEQEVNEAWYDLIAFVKRWYELDTQAQAEVLIRTIIP